MSDQAQSLAATADELEAMRDKWLMTTPDKTHTPWAIISRAIEACRASARREEKLREALKPFVLELRGSEEDGGGWGDSESEGGYPDDLRIGALVDITVGDLRRAAQAGSRDHCGDVTQKIAVPDHSGEADEKVGEPKAEWQPTHRHADGGLYRRIGDIVVKMPDGSWLPCIKYDGADGIERATSYERWVDRFSALTSAGEPSQ